MTDEEKGVIEELQIAVAKLQDSLAAANARIESLGQRVTELETKTHPISIVKDGILRIAAPMFVDIPSGSRKKFNFQSDGNFVILTNDWKVLFSTKTDD
jgi:CII-binding regulator of phage lambda lysogenization HflD